MNKYKKRPRAERQLTRRAHKLTTYIIAQIDESVNPFTDLENHRNVRRRKLVMKLLEVQNIPDKKGRFSDIVNDFMRSEKKVAEVTDWEGEASSAMSLRNGLHMAIKRKHIKECKVHCIQNRVFLEKI